MVLCGDPCVLEPPSPAKEIGAPDAIIADAVREQQSDPLKRFLKSIGTTLRILEEGTPWSNKAEVYIGLIKEAVRKDMAMSNCPLAFWDYCVERRARINNLTAKDRFQLHGQTARATVHGEAGDISNLWKFGWYEWCTFFEHSASFPAPKKQLGRILGPATGMGNEMCQWVLKVNGNVVPRRTVTPLTHDELHSPNDERRRRVFDQLIEKRFGKSVNASKDLQDSPTSAEIATEEEETWEPYTDEEEPAHEVHDMDDAVDARGLLINQQPEYD